MTESYRPQIIPGQQWKEGSLDIGFDQICMVKAVNNSGSLSLNKDGRIVIKTLAHATSGDIPRITNHWALNHMVDNNFGGVWAAPECVIISPAPSLIAKHGNPENLAVVDTFWAGDMEIPPGSVIYWKSGVPAELSDSQYDHRIMTVDSHLEEEGRQAAIALEAKKWTSVDELKALENKVIDVNSRLNAASQEQVNGAIAKLGYSVFNLESSGRYMLHKNLDRAVANLAESNGIPTSTFHAATFTGTLESDGIFEGPLFRFVRLNRGDTEEPEEIRKLINYTSIILKNNFVDTSLNRNARLIMSAELYYWLNSPGYEKRREMYSEQIANLLNSNPIIEEILLNWSAKEDDKSFNEWIHNLMD